MSRAEVNGTHFLQAGAMEDKAKREDGSSPKSERVALKKEIGLLTACAIIIGESGLPSWGCHAVVRGRKGPAQNRVTLTF